MTLPHSLETPRTLPLGSDPRSKLPSAPTKPPRHYSPSSSPLNETFTTTTDREMTLPKWLAYLLLLSRSLFHQKTILLLFLIFSVWELRQTTLHWGNAMITAVNMTCTHLESQVNSLMNLHVMLVRNMTHFEVNMVNSVATNAYTKSIEGLELVYALFVYSIERYFYAEKCLALGTISTILDYQQSSTSDWGDLMSSSSWSAFFESVSGEWGHFLNGSEPQQLANNMSMLSNSDMKLNGSEFVQWWQQQESSVKDRLNPISMIKQQLPTTPLSVLREDMFSQPQTTDFSFCTDIQWSALDNAVQMLIFFATIVLIVLTLVFSLYLIGSVVYAYWNIRRKIRHENKYSLRLLVDCGIFNGNMFRKYFLCYPPALNALIMGGAKSKGCVAADGRPRAEPECGRFSGAD
jgi:cbb3-type cytochrome oxidase subunit 3